ncbi:MAG: hypothetical protein ACREU7_10950, partial [Burkholderiales bacterium]
MSSGNEPGNAGTQEGFRRAALLVSGVVAYQFLVHFSLARPQSAQFAGLLAALPVLGFALWLLRRPGLPPKLAGAALAVASLVVAIHRGVSPAFSYFLLQIAVYLALFWLFAGSLRAGRQPLITRMARSVHGSLPQAIERYTRRVTWYWSGVLALLLAVSTGLFLLAPVSVWSFFANVL